MDAVIACVADAPDVEAWAKDFESFVGAIKAVEELRRLLPDLTDAGARHAVEVALAPLLTQQPVPLSDEDRERVLGIADRHAAEHATVRQIEEDQAFLRKLALQHYRVEGARDAS
jgi:hypothetical protein